MSDTVATAVDAARASARRMVMLAVGASLFSLLFVASYGYALHAPHPHDLRIEVADPAPSTVLGVRAALDHAAPGAFDVRAAADGRQARRSVATGSAYGALIAPASGPEQILTAAAGGVAVQQAVVGALTAQALAHGRPVQAVDLVPLPAADRNGQSSFVFEVGLLIPGVIGSLGFYLAGRRVRLWVRVAAAAGYSVLASAAGVLVLDTWLGALTGSPWTLLGTGALVAAAVVLTVAALHAALGLPGSAVAGAVLLVVGNAANGSTVPVPFLPDGYRQIAPWLPNGAAVHAFRTDVYFAGHGQGQPMLALSLWVLGALAVIVVADALHQRSRRVDPARHEQIHATSIVQHLHARRSPA